MIVHYFSVSLLFSIFFLLLVSSQHGRRLVKGAAEVVFAPLVRIVPKCPESVFVTAPQIAVGMVANRALNAAVGAAAFRNNS
jgi:hypothetical protein